MRTNISRRSALRRFFGGVGKPTGLQFSKAALRGRPKKTETKVSALRVCIPLPCLRLFCFRLFSCFRMFSVFSVFLRPLAVFHCVGGFEVSNPFVPAGLCHRAPGKALSYRFANSAAAAWRKASAAGGPLFCFFINLFF